jgi:hypothetical protein
MRIALRPSGGRGDYELAGSYNQRSASDLFEKRFFFKVTPGLVIDGKAEAHLLSGKPRIRPVEHGRHAYVIVSSILLLPSPRRELLKTPRTLPTLRAQRYTVAGIDVDVLEEEDHRVTFEPKKVWARSRGGLLEIDYAERMALISSIWGAAAEMGRNPVADLMREHKASVESGDHDRIVASAKSVQAHYRISDDVLPLLLRDFGLSNPTSLVLPGVAISADELPSEDDDVLPEESRRERTRKWRKQVDRGPGAREFSVRVKEAYDYRCFFSGERFPRLPVLPSSGVDGAHILPWSTHQLNSVPNGLCLCKQCHWAFDNGLIRLDFNAQTNDYLLSIPSDVSESAVRERFNLEVFQRNIGRIDRRRLPQNQRLWPSPDHISALNAIE